MPKTKSNAVIRPNLGIYFDRSSIALKDGMLKDGLNFRIKNGILSNLNLGWARFGNFVLNGPVGAIINFTLNAVDNLVFATQTDLYEYNTVSKTALYITPIYSTGTASASGTAVTGIGTLWLSNVAVGDEISFGNNNQTDPTATWFIIDSIDTDTGITLTTSAGTIVDGDYTIRKLFTGNYSDLWDFDIFVDADDGAGGVETQLWLTNGVDAPVRWNGIDTQVELMSSLNFTCKTLTVYSNLMIFGNITQGGTNKVTDIINSDVGKPDDVSAGLASQFKVHGGTDGLNKVKVLGDILTIYSHKQITAAQFVGGDLIFVFRRISNTVGAIAGRAIADFGDYHEFISTGSLYRFNGASITSVNNHVWRDILRRQDPLRVKQAFSFFNDQDSELFWIMPLITDTNSGSETAAPEKAYVEHYLEDVGNVDSGVHQLHTAYSVRSFPFTAIGYYTRQVGLTWDQISDQWQELNFRWDDQFFSIAFPLILVGDINGKIYTLNTNQNADGTALKSYVTFGRKALGSGRERHLLSRVYPFVRPFNNDINITVNMYDHASTFTAVSSTAWTYDQNLTESDFFVTPYRRGRFLELTFGTNGISKPWELEGYDLDIKPGGKR